MRRIIWEDKQNLASNYSKGFIYEAKTILAHVTAANGDKLTYVRDNELNALSDAFLMVMRSFHDATSAIEETTRKVASSSEHLLDPPRSFAPAQRK